ncbi:MAG: phage portal protein, partial [Patescibacteria group bacterium]|nr:phage portal protein [Patescibacteria group bacterium]
YKVRGSFGQLLGFIFVPWYQIEPRWSDDGSDYLSFYAYTVNGQTTHWPIEDVVHIRLGINPQNTRKGMTPIWPAFREVCTDNEAATFTAALLRNAAVPSMIITRKASPDGTIKELSVLQKDELKRLARSKFTGDSRGEPWINTVPLDIQKVGFSPKDMVVDKIRRIPEERITALIGIPAVVVGLGAGLDASSDKHNMEMAQRQAWHNCLIPLQRIIGDQIAAQTCADLLHAKPETDRLVWDRSAIPALKEDESNRRAMLRADWLAGGLRRSEYRAGIGSAIVEDSEMGTKSADETPSDPFYTDLVPAKPVTPGAGTSPTTGAESGS